MSDLSDAMSELKDAYQDVTGSVPTLTHDGETVECMPGQVGNDPMCVPGGIAEGESIEVATLATDWTTPPEKGDVVTLADHASADDGSYQVTSRRFHESWLVFTLGNLDARR